MAKRERDGLFQRKGSRYWWVRTDPITGKAESTGCVDREAARLWRANRERMHANPAHAAATQAELGDWCGRYLDMKARSWAEATLKMNREKLGHAIRLWGEGAKLADVGTPLAFDTYVKTRREEGISDHTASKEVSLLTRVLKLAKRGGCFAGDLDTLRPPDLSTNYKPRSRALTPDEVTALCAELPPARVAFVALCVGLGLRRSEALSLQPSDVDLNGGLVRVRGTKTEESDRVVPILAAARGLVEAALPYLPLKDGALVLNMALRRAARRAGIEHCSPNDLRRTHASLLLERGFGERFVSRLLGHTTDHLVKTTYGKPRLVVMGEAEQARLGGAAIPLLPAPIRDSQSAVLTESGRPQRESNPRYRRERLIQCPACSHTWNDSAALDDTREREPTRKRRWLRPDLEQSPAGVWLGRRGRAVA